MQMRMLFAAKVDSLVARVSDMAKIYRAERLNTHCTRTRQNGKSSLNRR
jgi:hypothetical protein